MVKFHSLIFLKELLKYQTSFYKPDNSIDFINFYLFACFGVQ